MTLEKTELKTNQVFTSDGNGSGIYLLFVDQMPPSPHDLLVTDFVSSFITADSAMSWYEKIHWPAGEPQALIAVFDGFGLRVVYRALVIGEEDHVPGHPGWSYAYDEEDMNGDASY